MWNVELLKVIADIIKSVVNSTSGIALMTFVFVWILLSQQLTPLDDINKKLNILISQNEKLVELIISNAVD